MHSPCTQRRVLVLATVVNYRVEKCRSSIQPQGSIAIAYCVRTSPLLSLAGFRGGAQGLVKDKVVLKRLVRQVMPAEVLSVSAKQAKQGGLEKRCVQ